MRVAIAGGHGTIALMLTKQLVERGDEVVSLLRDPEQSSDITDLGAEPAICDLEKDDGAAMAEAIGSADAVVFAAGAGPDSGAEKKETVDYEGAVKLIEAAKQLEAKRYVMVSSIGADADHEGEETMDIYIRAKGRADDALRESGLSHVIVRPGVLTDDQGTGQVTVGEDLDRAEIPREDVATVLAEALRAQTPAGHTFVVVSGETPVEEAVRFLGEEPHHGFDGSS